MTSEPPQARCRAAFGEGRLATRSTRRPNTSASSSSSRLIEKPSARPGAITYSRSTSLVGVATPLATDPKTASSATPYRPQTSVRRAASTAKSSTTSSATRDMAPFCRAATGTRSLLSNRQRPSGRKGTRNHCPRGSSGSLPTYREQRSRRRPSFAREKRNDQGVRPGHLVSEVRSAL